MKYKKGFAPLIVTILIVLAVGGVYVVYRNNSEIKKLKTETISFKNSPANIEVVNINNSLVSSLAPQAGLPPMVEVKRQALYEAAINRDYDRLVAEADIATRNSDTAEGPIFGFMQFLNNPDQDSKEIAFKAIPVLVQTQYIFLDYPGNSQYVWPSVAAKSPDTWTNEEISQLKSFMKDEEIEYAKEFGYYGLRLSISADGKSYFLVADD